VVRKRHPKGGTGMLILNREVSQEIMIGDDIRITVVEISGDNVRIGINAPRDQPVWRREIYKAMKAAEVAEPDSDCD
jgi:carbon storage regulator